MADLTDVSDALVTLLAQALYPNGTGQPSATGVPALIYAGWPQASQLDADLAAIPGGTGRIHVTVFPTKTERNTTRYSTVPQPQTVNAATITLTVNGQQITLGGTVSMPQNVAVLVDSSVYTYAVRAGDTLSSIATALAGQIQGASASGAVITIPNGSVIRAARAGGSGVSLAEIRRQQRVFQITVWADTPANRKTVATIIDPLLADSEFVTLADGTGARVIYQSSCDDDASQKANCYRRDLLYQIEYATTKQVGSTEVVVTQENVALGTVASVNETFYQ